jgi:hypothetical protein
MFVSQAKGIVSLQCSVCDEFFSSLHIAKRLPLMVPAVLSLSGEPR